MDSVLRVFANSGFINGNDSNLDPQEFRTSITTIGGGVIFDLSVKDILFPYFFAGIGSLNLIQRVKAVWNYQTMKPEFTKQQK